jgi:cation:H+ antiporter
MILLIASLLLILFASEGFTNGIEAFGKKHSLSQAVSGSVLAAVGTALPETILPLVAIFFGRGDMGREIGVGAILGAPFMLATAAFFVTGLAVLAGSLAGKRKFEINVEIPTIKRDLTFFVIMFSLAVFLPLVIGGALNRALSIIFVLGYIFYVAKTASGESDGVEHPEGLHLSNFFKKAGLGSGDTPSNFLIISQIVITIIIMVSGAHIFVGSLESISLKFGINPMLFALLLAPVATELPEKFNSITWILRKRDSLALGNITGAMVFQSTFPVSIGLILTGWKLAPMAVFSACIALVSALIILANIHIKKKISPYALLFGGMLYAIYVAAAIAHLRG